jgi:hypothetical protein
MSAPRALLAAAVTLLTLAGCSLPTPSGDGSPSPSPEPTGSAASVLRQPIDLRTPQGERIDLTGTWQGGGTFHEVRQAGDCVWWVGSSSLPEEELGSAWLLTFTGRLGADFTLRGAWADIYTVRLNGVSHCQVAFTIEFPAPGEDIQLVTDVNLPLEAPCSYYASTLTRVVGPP